MASQTVTQGGRTEFNLTLPLPMPDTTPAADDLNGVDEINLLSSPGILIGILVPHAVCTLVFLVRAWSRLFLLRKWFLDDTLITLAWAFATAICVLYGITTAQTGSATTTITAGSLPPAYVQSTYIPLLLYQLALLATVLSTLAFHHRLVTAASLFYPPCSSSSTSSSALSTATNPRHHHHRRNLARAATFLLPTLTTTALLVLTGLQCDPPTTSTTTSSSSSPAENATPSILGHPTATCAPFQPLLLSSFAAHTLFAFAAIALVVVPCATGRFAGLPARERRVLACGASGLGAVGVAAGVVRVLLVVGWLGDIGLSGGGGGGDGDGNRGGVESVLGAGSGIAVAGTGAYFVVTMAELDVLLVCACVPALRPVVARLWAEVVGRGRRVSGGSGRGVGEEGSVDLTSEVSYHGYPWTRDATPAANTPSAGSKNPSVLDVGGLFSQGPAGVPPVPPPPVMMAVHRTPTTLSLRSFVSGLAPRSRGRMEGEDCTGLLGDESQGPMDGAASRRRSSVGLEAYFEQFVGGDDSPNIQRHSVVREEARRSRGSKSYSGQWGDSQESFVLGVNDPNSPKRLSPVLGLGEAVRAELRRPESSSEKGLENR